MRIVTALLHQLNHQWELGLCVAVERRVDQDGKCLIFWGRWDSRRGNAIEPETGGGGGDGVDKSLSGALPELREWEEECWSARGVRAAVVVGEALECGVLKRSVERTLD